MNLYASATLSILLLACCFVDLYVVASLACYIVLLSCSCSLEFMYSLAP
jgi:hypothetical protein